MNRKFKTGATLVTVVLACTFLMGGLCDDLGQITFTIEHDTQEFTLDVDQALAENSDKIDVWDTLPVGQCIKLSDFLTEGLEIFPDPMNVDLGDNASEGGQVAQYRNHIEEVKIKELQIIITANSLSFALPAVELHAGPHGATKAELKWVAATESIPAAFTGTKDVEVTSDPVSIVGSALEDDMRFSFSFYSAYDDEICKGDTLGTITAKARVVADVIAEAL